MKIVSFLVLILFVSCAGIKIEGNSYKKEKISKSSDITYDYYIPYLKYPSTPIDMEEKCDNGNWKSIYVSNNFLTGIVPLVTLGLIRPQYARYECYVKSDT